MFPDEASSNTVLSKISGVKTVGTIIFNHVIKEESSDIESESNQQEEEEEVGNVKDTNSCQTPKTGNEKSQGLIDDGKHFGPKKLVTGAASVEKSGDENRSNPEHQKKKKEPEKQREPTVSTYVTLEDDDTVTSDTLQDTLNAWGITDHKLLFVYAHLNYTGTSVWDLLMEMASKAKSHGMNIAYVIIGDKQWPNYYHCNEYAHIPCIRVICKNEALLNTTGNVSINFSRQIGNWQSVSDTLLFVKAAEIEWEIEATGEEEHYSSCLHPVFTKYIITNLNVAEFTSMATALPYFEMSITFGDMYEFRDEMSCIEELLQGNIFKENILLGQKYDDSNWTGNGQVLSLVSMMPDTLLLKFVEICGYDETKCKIITADGPENILLNVGTVSSEILMTLPNSHTTARPAAFMKKYCVMGCSNNILELPSAIRDNLPEFNRLIMMKLTMDQPKGKTDIDEDAFEIINSVSKLTEGGPLNPLFLVLDPRGILFTKKTPKPFLRDAQHKCCIAILPLQALKGRLDNWNPKDNSVSPFPLKDNNGFVDTYIFVDDTSIQNGYNKLIWDFGARDVFAKYGNNITHDCSIEVTQYGGHHKFITIDSKSSGSIRAFIEDYGEGLPFMGTLVHLLIGEQIKTRIRCKPNDFLKVMRGLIFSSSDNRWHEMAVLTRLALCVIADMRNTNEADTRVLQQALARTLWKVTNAYPGMDPDINVEQTKSKYFKLMRMFLTKIGKSDTFCKMIRHPQLTHVISAELRGKGLDLDDTDFAELDHHPASDVYFTAVLCGNSSFAEEILKYTRHDELIANALFAVGVFKTEVKSSNKVFVSEEDIEGLQKSVDVMEGHAKAIIHSLYLTDTRCSENALFRCIKRYGNQTTFDLACMADARSFLSDKACTAAIHASWWGHLLTVPWWKIILYLLLPCLSCCSPNKKAESTDSGSLCRFYQIPAIKCTFHFFAFVFFLLLFSYIQLTGLKGPPTIAEYAILLWMITLLVEEGRQLKHVFDKRAQLSVVEKIIRHFSQFWNILDMVAIVCYIVGMILRVTAYFYDNNTLLMIGQAVLAVDIIVLYVRSLQFFSMHERIGPLFIMVRYMFEDMANFIVIAVVVLVGYGVALHSLLYPFSSLNISLIERILNVPYFQIYGELAVDTILEASPNETDSTISVPGFRNYFGLFLAGIFLLFVNILLLNLLIALFNSSYCRVEADTAFHNVLHQVEFLREYQSRSLLPPPLVIIEYLIIIPVRKCRELIKRHKQVDDTTNARLETWELDFTISNITDIVERYFANLPNAEGKSIGENVNQLKTLSEDFFRQLLNKMDAQGDKMDAQDKKLDEQAKELKELREEVNAHYKRRKERREKKKRDSKTHSLV